MGSEDLKVNVAFSFTKRLKFNERFLKLCESCKNYLNNGGCPRYSLPFRKVLDVNKNYILVGVKMNYLKVYPDRHPYILRSMRHSDWASLKFLNNVLSCIHNVLNGEKTFTFYAGNCRVCRVCTVPINNVCKKPKFRRVSPEAVQIDCEDISKRLFGVPLVWYKAGTGILPEYIVRVSVITSKKPLVGYKKIILKNLKRVKFIWSGIEYDKEVKYVKDQSH